MKAPKCFLAQANLHWLNYVDGCITALGSGNARNPLEVERAMKLK